MAIFSVMIPFLDQAEVQRGTFSRTKSQSALESRKKKIVMTNFCQIFSFHTIFWSSLHSLFIGHGLRKGRSLSKSMILQKKTYVRK